MKNGKLAYLCREGPGPWFGQNQITFGQAVQKEDTMGKHNAWLGKMEALLNRMGGTVMADAILRDDYVIKLEPSYLGLGRVASPAVADKILGDRTLCVHVLEVQSYLLHAQPRGRINYSRDTIIKCAAENENGTAKWCLVYCPGLSLMQMIDKHFPNDFRLNLSNHITPEVQQAFISTVVNQFHKAGYYLVDLLPDPMGIQARSQDLVQGTLEAPFPLIVNSLVMIMKKYGSGIPAWPTVFRSVSGPDGSRVVFGLSRDQGEFRVNFLRPDYPDLHQQFSTQTLYYKPWEEFKE